MSTRVLVVILSIGFTVVFVMALFGWKSYDYSQSICMNCGLEKSEDVGKFGAVTYRSRRTFEDTAVSAALKVTNCSHTWFLYRFGRGHRQLFLGGKVNADGGSPAYMIQPLRNDPRFAMDLAALPRASTVWSNLLVAVDSSRELNESLGRWWEEGLDRGSFSNWWDDVSQADVGGDIGEPEGGANVSQPFRSETNRTSGAAGSRRSP